MLRNRHQVTPERLARLDRRTSKDGTLEDPYVWIARQINTARPLEITALYMLRNDEVQRRAMELAIQANTLRWTRHAVIASTVTSVLASLVAIVAVVAR